MFVKKAAFACDQGRGKLHRPRPNFREELGSACNRSILARNGASGKPGALQAPHPNLGRLMPMWFHFLLLMLMLMPIPATAVDGVLEINNSCALSPSGCFPGDASGYPVTITRTGSFRLTGNLQSGIYVTAPNVSIDLNGFTISSVDPNDPEASCTSPGSGAGIACAPPNCHNMDVRNGTIACLAYGVQSTFMTRIENVKALENSGDGFEIGPGSRITNSIAVHNDASGIVIAVTGGQDPDYSFQMASIENNLVADNAVHGISSDRSVIVRGNRALSNGQKGFQIGSRSVFEDNLSADNSLVDTCGGGVCTAKRRFYLEKTVPGGGVDPGAACAQGFRMASVVELVDVGNLEYDYLLDDIISFSEPPSGESGFVLTGQGNSSNLAEVPIGTCGDWTTASSQQSGTAAFLSNINYHRAGAASSFPTLNSESGYGIQAAADQGSTASNSSPTTLEFPYAPWLVEPRRCDLGAVWCIEEGK